MSAKPVLYMLPGLLCDETVFKPQTEGLSDAIDVRVPRFLGFDSLTDMARHVLEIGPAYEDRLVRIELFGDEVEAIRYVDPTTGEILQSLETINIYPAKHFVTPKERLA